MTREDELRQVMQELLGLEPADLPADRPLGELGVDSLTAAEVSVHIEDRYGLTVPLERFLGDETLADIARDLEPAA